MKTEQEQIEEMAVIGCVRNPQAHTAEECSKCDFKQGMCNAYRHAEALYNVGYGNVSEYETEIERLRQEVRDTDKMARNTIEQYRAENKELENALKQSEDNYSRAFERLKAQEREIERLKAENDSLNKKISELEQDLIHADENVFYRECDVKLAEDKIEAGTLIEIPGIRKLNIDGMDCVEAVYIQHNGTIGECVCLNEAEAKKELEEIRSGNNDRLPK